MADQTTLIRGGTVVDGTGREPVRADVAVRGDRIVAIGTGLSGPADRVIDADGQVVCPGFVDAHGHSDLALLSSPSGTSKLLQGVTTEVAGNCGLGPGPTAPGTPVTPLRDAMSFIDVDPSVGWDWPDLAGYRARLRRARPALNVANLAAHLPLHVGACGFGRDPATPAQLSGMQQILGQAFAHGAAGLSTGLAYPPLGAVTEAEFIALGQVVRAAGKVFCWHLADYGDRLVESAEQALRVAGESGCRTQISHLVAVGQRNWGKVATVLDLLESAAGRGLDVRADVYPYTAGSTVLAQLVPAWAHQGGPAALVERLGQPEVRSRLAQEMASQPLAWSEVRIVQTSRPGDPAVGQSVEALARQTGATGPNLVFDLIVAHNNRVNIVAAGRSEADVKRVLTHPMTVMGSDGIAVDPDGASGAGLPHPRSFGAYPRLVGDWVAAGTMALADAMAACTLRPAMWFGLRGRGALRPGAYADVLVLDHARFRDRATYEVPHRSPEGLTAVLVNGQLTVADGRLTGLRAGAVL